MDVNLSNFLFIQGEHAADNPFLSRVYLYAHRQTAAPPNALSPSGASSPVHTTFPPNAPFRSSANGKEASASIVNSPVIQGTRPATTSGRAKDKKEALTKEGQGRKDGVIVDKDEAGDGKAISIRAAVARGKMGSAVVEGLGVDGVHGAAAASGGYPDDRISDGTQDTGPFRIAPALHSERRDSSGRGDTKGPTSPGSPAKETRAGHQGSPMEGVESTPSVSASRKGAGATADVPSEELPMHTLKKTSSSSHHAHHQPQVPVTPVAHSSSVKRKRGSVDHPHSRNDPHGDAAYTDHHAASGRSHQASAPSGRGHASSHHTQAALKREPGQPVTPTTASHQTHHRRTSSTTTASALRDQPDSRPEPPPPLRDIPIANPVDDEEEDEEPVDPNEPRYCFCNQVSYGQMVGCDDRDCAREWFHLSCVGLTHPPNKKGMNNAFLSFALERRSFANVILCSEMVL